ncbi:MAG: TRAP transporter small permease subunit [Synergistaceae bacterium]|nr:TRAP transporter small permease subunit [Synergistaceae bacterium]
MLFVLLKKINDVLCAVLKVCCLFLVAVFTLVVLFQVLARNYLLISVPWTDEVALIFFVWSVFLGAALGLRRRMHFLVELFPRSCVCLNSFLDVVSDFLVLGVVGVLLWGGAIFSWMGLRRKFSSILVTQAYLFVSMPATAFCMLLFSVENLSGDLRRLKQLLFGEGGK